MLKKYRCYLLFLWIYSIFVITWGAWVRISKSGDGCGTSWPLCKDVILPNEGNIHTWIEFTHRASTGLYGILILLLLIFTFKLFPKKPVLKKLSVIILSLTIIEVFNRSKTCHIWSCRRKYRTVSHHSYLLSPNYKYPPHWLYS